MELTNLFDNLPDGQSVIDMELNELLENSPKKSSTSIPTKKKKISSNNKNSLSDSPKSIVKNNNTFSVNKSFIFPSLLYEIDCSDLIDETLEIFKKSEFPEYAPYATESVYILNENKSLIKKFEERLNYAVEDVQFDVPFKMTTSWFTSTPPNYPIHIHNHVNCYWSASFYFFDNCSPLHIMKDKNAIYVPFKTSDPRYTMSGTISIPASKGKLIVFPSHLHHYISQNTHNTNRYSLAMNFMPDGLCSFYDSAYLY